MKQRKIPRPFKMPWGKGQIVEEAYYRGKYHEPAIQLMEYKNGSFSIRFCYFSDGMFQRSPLMMDVKELARLKAALKKAPRLRKLLKKIV